MQNKFHLLPDLHLGNSMYYEGPVYQSPMLLTTEPTRLLTSNMPQLYSQRGVFNKHFIPHTYLRTMATKTNEHLSGMSRAQFRCVWRVTKDVTLRISVSLDTYQSLLRGTPKCNLRACVGYVCAARHACVLWQWVLRMGSML